MESGRTWPKRAATLWLGTILGAMAPGACLAFDDDEACLMCHKYPMLGRVTEEGTHRSYHVPPATFSRTVHRNVPCRDCHTEIRELPHKPVVEGVRCDTKCHSVINPSTGLPFSHQDTYNSYRGSVHGREKIEKDADADKPYCIACHKNPIYNPAEDRPPKQITERCNVCHKDREFAAKWYDHTSRRIRGVKRDRHQIAELCASCHADAGMIARRQKIAEEEGRQLGPRFAVAAESYMHSFHGKMSRLGRDASPTCLDCHIETDSYFANVHAIVPSYDERSPLNRKHRSEVCGKCHGAAGRKFTAIDPHSTDRLEINPFGHYAKVIYDIVGNTALAVLLALAALETFGRRRDGASWGFRRGTSWLRYLKRQSRT